MEQDNLIVVIPASKKTVAFQDDLVKKLGGISLIQRAIDKALHIEDDKNNVYLLTDSDEIRLIADRNKINSFFSPKLDLNGIEGNKFIINYLQKLQSNCQYFLLLSPYVPLLKVKIIFDAIQAFKKSQCNVLKPIKKIKKNFNSKKNLSLYEMPFNTQSDLLSIESNAFTIFEASLLKNSSSTKLSLQHWPVSHDLLEIESYHDWWVCEKLLNRKRILFRVVGDKKIGMGHIYRSLSIAHEISDHEILFVCDEGNAIAVNKLAGYDYWLEVYKKEEIVKKIIELKPDLVINDILDTTQEDILPLKKNGIKVMNFEDLGDGACLADITINELYDNPRFDSKNILWGNGYFFIRDEFNGAKENVYKNKVESILISFGGTDQHNLTLTIYRSIKDICKFNNIKMYIVTGPGYIDFEHLKEEVNNDVLVELTNATGVISSIMEKSQVAIISNGRTVYELAQMNIPAIVISQHERECNHDFSVESNGFIDLGIYRDNITDIDVVNNLNKLIEDDSFRKMLMSNMQKISFIENKKKVIKTIINLIAD